MKEKLLELLKPAIEAYTKLSSREKSLVITAAVVVGFWCIYSGLVEPVRNAFEAQAITLSKVEKDFNNLNMLSSRYALLTKKKGAVEDNYKKVEIKEGVRSYLGNLLQTKARIAAGQYNIQAGLEKKLGDNFEQASFTVSFDTTNLSYLVDLLVELIRGPSPVVLNKIDIDKRRRSDRLGVTIDISSIRRTS